MINFVAKTKIEEMKKFYEYEDSVDLSSYG